MSGQKGRRQYVAGYAACGDDRQSHGERAFSHAGNVVDGEYAHKIGFLIKKVYETIINFLLFFVKRIKMER